MEEGLKSNSHKSDVPARRFKIAFFLLDLGGNGAARVVVTLCNALAELGHETTLILRDSGGHYTADLSPKVRLVALNRRLSFGFPRLVRILRDGHFDCLIAGSDLPNTTALLTMPFLSRRMRIIVTEHNNPEFIDRAVLIEKRMGNARARMIRRLRPYLYRLADRIVLVSERLREPTISRYDWNPHKVVAIPNPVETDKVAGEALEPADHPWLRRRSGILFVACGRLDAQKDFPTLLRALAKLRQRTAARLIILGEGPDRDELERLAVSLNLDDVVSMPGFVRNPFAFIARADAFVLSSIYEGLVTVVIEALACGTPVVSTDCAAEILEDGKWGLLVPPSDPAALAVAMEETLNVSRRPEELKRRAAYYSPDRAVERYLAMIESLAKNSP